MSEIHHRMILSDRGPGPARRRFYTACADPRCAWAGSGRTSKKSAVASYHSHVEHKATPEGEPRPCTPADALPAALR